MSSGQRSCRMVKVGSNVQRSPCPALTVQAGLPRARWLLNNSKDGESITSRGNITASKWFVMFRRIQDVQRFRRNLWVPFCAHCLSTCASGHHWRAQLHLLCTMHCGSWLLHILKIKDPPKPSPLQAELPQLSQPFLRAELPHSLHHLCGSWPHSLQHIHSSPVLRSQDWTDTSRPGFSSAEPRGRIPSWSSWQWFPNAAQESTADAFAARAHCQNGSWISGKLPAKTFTRQHTAEQGAFTCPSTAPEQETQGIPWGHIPTMQLFLATAIYLLLVLRKT